MKINFFIICLSLLALDTLGQSSKKTLYGSFVFENNVYQYRYKKEGSIHSLQLSNLSQSNLVTSLDEEKLTKSITFLKEATKKETSIKLKKTGDSIYVKNFSDSTLDTIAQLPHYIDELFLIRKKQTIWKQQLSGIDGLLKIFKQYKIESIKLGDTAAIGIYSAEELLTAYKSFLENNREPESTSEIPFPELKQDEFRVIFSQQLQQLSKQTKADFDKKTAKLNLLADEIMFEIKARVEFKEDEPVTAYMILKRKYIELPFRYKIKTDKGNPGSDSLVRMKLLFEVKNISVEFEDGGIKNIFADLQPQLPEYIKEYGTNTLRFRNIKPISTIGKYDPDIFRDHKIHLGNQLELMQVLLSKLQRENPTIHYDSSSFLKRKQTARISFILSNLLDYKVVSEIDNEDYSPTNSKIELSETHVIEELKKEKRSNILTARAYSDFMGLSGEQPNGLVQLEVSKKVNLLSGRGQGFLTIANNNQRGIYSGGLTFIEPKITISKIEESFRYLSLDSGRLDKSKSFADSTNHFTVNPLELLQYQQWSFGLNANLFKFNLQNRKSNFQINMSLQFGRTSVSDSIKITQNKITQKQSENISRINTTMYGFGLQYELKPDSRYGFSFGYEMRWVDILNRQFEYSKDFNNKINTAWFHGFFKVNDNSKLFWRFRKNWISQNNKYNFYQIQMGYELDLFKGNK